MRLQGRSLVVFTTNVTGRDRREIEARLWSSAKRECAAQKMKVLVQGHSEDASDLVDRIWDCWILGYRMVIVVGDLWNISLDFFTSAGCKVIVDP